MLPLLFMVIPRYLYILVFSSTCSPIVLSVFGVFPLMVIDWLFSFPNLMWYLFASSLVVFNIFLSSSLSWWIRETSSIHSRHPGIMLFHSFWFPMVSSCSYFDMSSIRFAYSMTDRTPPCLMLSLILIVLVGPYCVLMVAVRFLFISRAILQFLPVRPLLCIVYIIAFSQALSYAFVTSRNAIYSSFFLLFFTWFIGALSIIRWSAVAIPCWPPACDSVIVVSTFILLFNSLSNNFPALLAKVMPLSLLYFPFVPFPLYNLLISPCCHCCGICSSLYIVFRISRYIPLVCSSASMNTSFGVRSVSL